MLHRFEDSDGTQRLYAPAELVRLAAARCGLPEAAGQAGGPALEQLCAAFEAARPQQTTFGKLHAQAILLDSLGKRLGLADYLQHFPQIRVEPLPSLVFIVAPFRTGTTFLHRLLACDPENRWPRIWEVAYPPPSEPHLRADPRYFAEDARIEVAAAALRTLHRASPALNRLHPMSPNLADECFGLLETSFLSHSFMFYAELSPYLHWLDARDGADWRAAYQTYAVQLRLLQWWYPGQRWVLKSPVHLWNLDILLETFPQAFVIQLHRDPGDAMGSFCRLLASYRQVMCKAAVPAATGAQARRYMRQVLQRAVAARRRADASRFIDLRFADLMRDPISSIQSDLRAHRCQIGT